MKIKVDMRGDKALAAKLRELSKSEMKKALQDGAKKSLEPIRKLSQSIAPKKTGTLRRAHRIRVLKRSRKRIGARVTIQANDPAFVRRGRAYGPQVELGTKRGTKRILPVDYMRKAAKERRFIVIASFGGWVRKMIHKVVKKRKV